MGCDPRNSQARQTICRSYWRCAVERRQFCCRTAGNKRLGQSLARPVSRKHRRLGRNLAFPESRKAIVACWEARLQEDGADVGVGAPADAVVVGFTAWANDS
jgi:hypothetical protein